MPFSFAVKRRVARLLIFLAGIVAVPYIPGLVFIAISQGGIYQGISLSMIALFCLPWVVIFLHNILRLKIRVWKRCQRIFELLSSLAQFFFLLILVVLFMVYNNSVLWISLDAVTFMILLALVFLAVQAVSILGSLLDMWTLGRASLLQPYNLSRGPSDGNESEPIDIFGAQTWRKRYDSEGRYMPWARGTGAILCFAVAMITGFYGLFYQPARSARSTRIPSKLYWDGRFDFYNNPPLNAIMMFPGIQNITSDAQLNDAISVNVTGSSPGGTELIRSVCQRQADKLTKSSLPPNLTVFCQIPGHTNIWPKFSRDNLDDFRRELIYLIDFSPTIDLLSLVSFYLANTTSPPEDVEAVIRGTQSTLIWPGARLLALGSVSEFERLSNPAAAAFGVTKATPLLMYSISSVLQDPSPPPLNNNQSASIRVVFDFLTLYMRVEQESSENTILTGFSFVGGVWTFLDGIFRVVFGCTLTLILFGIKPLSVYGLVHLFSSTNPGLYTNQDYDLSPDDETKVIRTLRQHLLDIGDDKSIQRPSETMDSSENVEKRITSGSARAEQA